MLGKVKKYGYVLDLDTMQVSVDKSVQKCYSKADMEVDFTPEQWARIEEAKKKVNKISDEEAMREYNKIAKSIANKMERRR